MDRTQASGYTTNAAGKRVYADKVPGQAQGTSLVAADRTATQEEIVGAIEASGQTPDPVNLAQLQAAIKVLGNAPVWSAAFAKLIGGYPNRFLVQDASSAGVFWLSTVANNLTTPGESGASWGNLFAGLATETYAAQYNPGRYLNTTVITSSQTYTVPAGVYKIRVRLQAAGGAAGGSADNTGGNGSSCASSGGAGAYVEAIFPVTPGQQIPISIGVGGVGVTGKAGGTGGATTFGPFGSFAALSCPGGLGGYAGIQTSSSAASSIPGCPGNGMPSGPNIVYAVAAAGGLPGVAVLGTAAAPPGSNSPMGAGGSGITGYNGSTSQPGGNAGGWGGGGGAHANQQAAQNAGGAGANGVGIIDEFSA
ncbi:hypothetical protein C0V97_01160 [Asaia sp. W19]|uniref:glycine-rich domain-containing protein n=1 Tax=unclassified Asaia TaxID=2685023 RepID=UPI000F8EF181|nr:hypothetical protein [Asaia sp. W19]RUT27408.1 hypothetical protein C0V97_01160 [Asaia sp. W19]